jgi:hypothetical protein
MALSAVRSLPAAPVAGLPYADVVRSLANEFPSAPPDVVEGCVVAEGERYRDATVTAFVGILVERAARRRLSSWAAQRDRPSATGPLRAQPPPAR